jgi:1-phosphofructokinase
MKIDFVSMAMSGSTIVVGLNGALQKRFVLPTNTPLVPGNVHRAQTIQTGLGGKGQDVAVTLNCLNYDGDLQLAQFVGNDAPGDMVYDMIVDKLGQEATALTVRPNSSMRTCTSIVGTDATTELVEPSGVITEQEMAELMSKLEALSDPPAALCIMGSMPPGCADDTYAQMYKRVASPNMLCLVDSVVGVDTLIDAVASMDKPGPTLYKINASELCKLAAVAKSKGEVDGVDLEELTEGISSFIHKFAPGAAKLRGIAITDGKHPAYFAAFQEKEFSLYRLPTPVLKDVSLVYPIGAGDSVAAGTLAAWRSLSGSDDTPVLPSDITKAIENHAKVDDFSAPSSEVRSMVSAFAFGLACGSASKSSIGCACRYICLKGLYCLLIFLFTPFLCRLHARGKLCA